MKTACLFFVLLSCFLFGCTDAKYGMHEPPETYKQKTVDYVSLAREMADGLIANIQTPLDKNQIIIVTSFADINDLASSSTTGRMLSELVASRLVQQGYRIKDIRSRQDSIYISEGSGEFVLSRDIKALSRQNNASAIVAGTYGIIGQTTVVSVRLLRAEDSMVLSAADGSFTVRR